jgi:hypothetical protein
MAMAYLCPRDLELRALIERVRVGRIERGGQTRRLVKR